MEETFELHIEHNGKQMTLPGEFRRWGYTHRIYMQVNGIDVIFEPDEERNFRAIAEAGQDKVDAGLVRKIIEELERGLK